MRRVDDVLHQVLAKLLHRAPRARGEVARLLIADERRQSRILAAGDRHIEK
jgi:predicted RNA polymerase sigma factor